MASAVYRCAVRCAHEGLQPIGYDDDEHMNSDPIFPLGAIIWNPLDAFLSQRLFYRTFMT